jgi:hypothetical protein
VFRGCLLKTRGRTHTTAEKFLLTQVKEAFILRKGQIGAKQAAKELNVSLASFYNYVAGTDLPRMEVLKAAQEKWGTKWKLLDPSEIVLSRKADSPEQYVFSFLKDLCARDVEVTKVGPKGESALQVTLKIRFPA